MKRSKPFIDDTVSFVCKDHGREDCRECWLYHVNIPQMVIRRFQREEIGRMLGVPVIVVESIEKSGGAG